MNRCSLSIVLIEYILELESIKVFIQKPLLDGKQTSRYILSNTPELVGKLLAMFSNPSPEVGNEAWKFIIELPKDEVLMERLKILSITHDQEWSDCLGIGDINDTAYVAYLLHGFYITLTNKSILTQDYVKKLKNKYCFDFIYAIFANKISKEFTGIIIRCLYYCIEIMNLLWNVSDIKKSINGVRSEENMWCNLTMIIKWVLIEGMEKLNSDEIPYIFDSCVETLGKLLNINRPKFEIQLVKNLCKILTEYGNNV